MRERTGRTKVEKRRSPSGRPEVLHLRWNGFRRRCRTARVRIPAQYRLSTECEGPYFRSVSKRVELSNTERLLCEPATLALGKTFKRARRALLDLAIPKVSLAVGRQCSPTTARDRRSLEQSARRADVLAGSSTSLSFDEKHGFTPSTAPFARLRGFPGQLAHSARSRLQR